METFELKVGDKIELRDDLEDGKYYGSFLYFSDYPKKGWVSEIDSSDNTIQTEERRWHSIEMIFKVNDKKVKFVKGFEYTIMED